MKGFGNHLALALSCAASLARSMRRARKFPTTSSASACSTTSPASSRTPTAWVRWKPRAWRRRISTAGARTSRSRSSMPITRTRPTSAGDRAQMARCRRRRRHRRRAEFGRRAFDQCAAAGFADDVPGVVHRQLRSHRQGLFAQHHPVGQRRLGDRQHDRGGDDGARRQGLVLRHGRLRARQGHRGGSHQLYREARRQGAGSSKHPLGTSDFASFLLQAQNSKAK